jgi:hypothetical protein
VAETIQKPARELVENSGNKRRQLGTDPFVEISHVL